MIYGNAALFIMITDHKSQIINHKFMSALYLIPVTLGDVEHRRVLPEYNREVILSIRHFIVENVRTARRFLKKRSEEHTSELQSR